MSTWNDFFNDAEAQMQEVSQHRAMVRRDREATASLERMAAKYDDMAATRCGFEALTESLKRQLQKSDPKNPLITDRALRLKVFDAAYNNYTTKFKAGKGQDFEGSIDIGWNFPIPGRD